MILTILKMSNKTTLNGVGGGGQTEHRHIYLLFLSCTLQGFNVISSEGIMCRIGGIVKEKTR